MADLLTHYVSARVCGRFVRERGAATLVLVGAALPDLVSKPMQMFPGIPDYAEVPSHSVVGVAFLCWAAALHFAEGTRRNAFLALYAGSLLHVGVDFLKDNLGYGSVAALHPLSLESFEAGLYQTEDALMLIPANLGILALLWAMDRRGAARKRLPITSSGS